MSNPTLYRNRLIPLESILLTNDEILYHDDKKIITFWKTLHPKSDLAYGYSCYFLDWYCDIIETNYEKDSDTYVFTDLLADVIVKPDGNTRVVDLDELADAFERGLLSSQRMSCALRQLDDLLQAIYRDRFESLTEPLMNQIAEYESSQQKA